MPIANPFIPALNAGEVSETAARADLNDDWYRKSCRTLLNFVAMPEGPATARPGTRFIAAAKHADRLARRVPFQFSAEQAYMLELGDQYLRFFRNKGRIDAETVAAVIANGGFNGNISGWSDESSGTGAISHSGSSGRMSLDGGSSGTAAAEQEIAIAAADESRVHSVAFEAVGAAHDFLTVTIGSGTGASDLFGPYKAYAGVHVIEMTPANPSVFLRFASAADKAVQLDNVAVLSGEPIELATSWTAAQLRGVKWVNKNDIMYLVRAGVEFRKLERRGHRAWALIKINAIDGPYLDANITATTLTAAATTGLGVTLTASATDGINNDRGFLATDVGRSVRHTESATTGWARIVGYTSPTVVTADIMAAFGGTGGSDDWRLGLYSDTTGWPAAVALHKRRLALAGAADVPDRVDLSAAGAFETFAPDGNDGDAIGGVPLGGSQVQTIRWLVSDKSLLVGTQSGLASIASNDTTKGLTPSTADPDKEPVVPVADIQPVEANEAILFMQRSGRTVRELRYVQSAADTGFVADSITKRARHISRSGIIAAAWQAAPMDLLWTVRADGVLAALTYDRAENTAGWHRHVLGGSFASGAAVVEDVAVIPPSSGDNDEVWLAVKRTINGATVRYTEVLEDFFEEGDALADAFFVDCGLTYDGPPVTVVTGAEHLEGETVQLLVDGATHEDAVVTGGQVTLSRAGSKVHLGEGYVSDLVPSRPEVGSGRGTAQTINKRVVKAGVRYHNTNLFKIGPDADHLQEVNFRLQSDDIGAPVPLRTGTVTEPLQGPWGPDGDFLVRRDKPLPCTIVSLVPEIEVNP